MDFDNFSDVTALVNEFMQAKSALDLFDHGGRIVSMSIGQPDQQGVAATTVRTADFDYPQQMVEAIKGMLHSRQDEIEQRLQELGVNMSGAR